jgi:hypothetical protein
MSQSELTQAFDKLVLFLEDDCFKIEADHMFSLIS